MAKRNYSNKPSRQTLAASITNSATSLTVTGTAPLVSDLLPPYVAVLDRGTATEEVVLVTAESGTGTVTCTIVRAWAGTTAQAHASGSSFEHSMTAGDLTTPLVPTYAGDRRKPFDPTTSFYNVTESSMQKMRSALVKSQSQRVKIGFWGHSIYAGSFTSAIGSYDIASQTRRYLNAEGSNVNGTGMTYIANNPGANPALGRDARWTSITGWTPANAVNNVYASTTTNGAVATFVSDAPGTIVDWATHDNTGTVEVRVDGILKDTFGPGGTGTTVVVRSITGLPNTKHTVTFTTTSTTLSFVVGCRVRNATGLEVSNLSNGGTTSANWAPTGAYYSNYKTANVSAPSEIVFLSLDGNEMFQSYTAAAYKTQMQGLLTALVATGAAVVLMSAPAMVPAGGSYATLTEAYWDEFMYVLYDLADQYDLPLLDARHLYQTYAIANGLGWMGDTIHPNDVGHAVLARSLATEMLKVIPYDTKPDAMLEEYEVVPTAPATGLKFFTKYGARRIPAFMAAGGQWSAIQPGLFGNRISWLAAINNSATPSVWGMAAPTYVNGAGSTPTAVAIATTNLYTSITRFRLAGTAIAGNAGSMRTAAQWFTSSTANMGGFFFVARFGLNATTATNRVFVGMSATTTALAANADPSTFLNMFGIAADSAHTTFRFMHNDGSGTATSVDCGTSFSCQTAATNFYEVRLYAPPGGGNTVNWCIIRLNDGVQRQGIATTDLPAINTMLAAHIMHSNGTTGATPSVDIQSLYVEQDN